MRASDYLIGTAVAGAAAHGVQQGSRFYEPMMHWIDYIRPRDRHNIINGYPLEVVDAPPVPAAHPPQTKSLMWVIPGVLLWLIGALLVGIFAVIGQEVGGSSEYATTADATPGFVMFMVAFFLASVILVPLGIGLSIIMRAFKFRRDAAVKVQYDASVQWYSLWEQREQARRMLRQGQIPVGYCEFLGLDPELFMRS